MQMSVLISSQEGEKMNVAVWKRSKTAGIVGWLEVRQHLSEDRTEEDGIRWRALKANPSSLRLMWYEEPGGERQGERWALQRTEWQNDFCRVGMTTARLQCLGQLKGGCLSPQRGCDYSGDQFIHSLSEGTTPCHMHKPSEFTTYI